MPGPLHGVRVLDLTRVVFGPLTTRVLADLGAEVWKVEPPHGDIGRQMGHVAAPGVSAIHLSCNGNKRGVCVDLRHRSARSVLLRVAAHADVFVHSMTPGAITGLGLTYADVVAANPRIVYANCWGFGREGPYAGLPAYDDIIQGVSGLVALQAKASGESAFSPSILCDKVCALYAVSGISAALYRRAVSGEGAELEFPMFELMTAFTAVEHLDGRIFADDGPTGYRRALSPHRRPFPTTDGAVTILPYQDKHWRSVAALLGQPALAVDPRLATVAARQAHPELVADHLARFAAARTTSECLKSLRDNRVPCGPVLGLDDLVEDEHLAEVGFWRHVEHPEVGPVHLPAPAERPAPALGQDTAAVLAGCGFSRGEIAALAAGGVVHQAGQDSARSDDNQEAEP
ncbi:MULTISPECIES: CaiB/BaiF CoA transferase family protein [Amycolatopsis]|uniref:Crotonobetainyl-CoA:carnitine CoA-transferase CaiB n=2 Tax=Amycolatopsis TaxID=1813 RepID=A0A1I3XCV5_9PSEU|nr:CoA transferase [Amycolatopsis sacchari]SFK17363.1 Crotonobetainyl-CoA:carnitine CoA-transferase CaiB [Amycolatopsis sacchari]